jgi:outer membrane protein assembly factor BamB
MEPLQAGDPRRIGEFRLHARLGAGGMGQVFLGYSPAGRAVAVKICHPDLASDPAFLLRFAREVESASLVNGLFTAPVVGAGPHDNPPWLATTYVPGPSLQQTVRGFGPLPEAAVWRLAAGLAEALRAIHARGIVHRDLKPTNVLLAEDGPRVIDFGIARALDSAVLTTAGYALGSPSYMSPEQVAGQPADPASDVFALGSMICFASCGVVPFGEGDAPSVLFKILYEQPVLDAMPSPALRELAAACLTREPGQRATLAQVLGACQPYVHGGAATSFWPGPVAELIARYAAVPAPPPPEPTAPPRPALPPAAAPAAVTASTGPSRRGLLAGVAGVAAAGLVAGGWALSRSGTPANATQSRMLWRHQTGGPVTSGAGIDGGVVYIGGQDGHIYALHAASGHLVRAIPADGAVTGGVTVSGGLIVAGSVGRRVHGVPVAGGKAWLHITGGPVQCKAAVLGGVVYIGSDDHYLYALHAGDGKRIWRAKTGGAVRSTPASTSLDLELGNVYAGSDDGNLYQFGTGSGKVGWRFRADSAINGGPLVSDGAIYVGTADGSLYEVDPGKGTEDGLSGPFTAGGAIEGTPVRANQIVYIGSADSSVYAVDSNSGAQDWRYRTGGPVRSGLAVSGNAVYAGSDDGYLYAIDIGSGHLLWRYQTGGAIQGQILATDDAVYFGSLDHYIYALATS